MSLNLSRDRIIYFLLVIVAVMAVEVLYLMYQNHELQSMLDNPSKYLRTLQPEDSVPTIRGQDISGADLALRYGPGEPYTLLLWFSAGCSSCTGNFAYWATLQQKYQSPQLRIIGFCAGSLEEARQVQQEHGLKFPILSVTDQFLVAAYKGNIVPQTLLIDPAGIVQQVWPGELLESQKDQIALALTQIPSLAVEGGDQQ